jgi:hypothetical protein
MTVAYLTCDQAIFTSIRGAMGEGYRIVAASRGLRPEEKQAITRLSPSHEALCWQPGAGGDADPAFAAAFYPLPTGRLCVAYSSYAGAEHTARGGHRVYTHNLVFEERDFSSCEFNPFRVIRAMIAAGLTVPDLAPGTVLPEVRLPIDAGGPPSTGSFAVAVDSPHRRYALQGLFDERTLVVPLQTGWVEAAEALLLGVPGPMRSKVSLGAGLRYSVGRCHRLHVFCDEKGAARSRIVGQAVEYLDPMVALPDAPISAWLAFVDRHWTRADGAALSRRTSRPFTDVAAAARERIGNLYNAIDAVPQASIPDLLTLAVSHLGACCSGVEDDIRKELLAGIHQTLLRRLAIVRWAEAQPFWPRLVALWRRKDAAFAQPLIDATLRALMRENALVAAEAALDVASDVPPGLDPDHHTRLLGEVLDRLASHRPSDAEPERLAALCARWQSARPDRQELLRLIERRAIVQPGTPART